MKEKASYPRRQSDKNSGIEIYNSTSRKGDNKT